MGLLCNFQELSPKRVPVVEVTRNGCGAFHPLRKEKSSDEAPAVGNVKLLVAPAVEPAVAAAPRRRVLAVVVVVVVVGEKVKMKGSRIGKLDGVSRQNGIDIATPKQIRELMKVDGLTNDEVKSHLQGEYR
ncbi:putative transcription factor MYB-HB-like family [Helianthus annuus]|nr:putative transcription factor MYB-HB-like family [Helianthus annuus]KAJ0474948.1 putative transcription factor MYB-HB-like family [Helianthus annuus]KAJ0650503.1 putative transcription factor MYB-HB-like family [Helianthus annuus]KAJ0846944.1 putative transcription factor MYB-HB-like family [Helianthus annuus]